MDRKAAAQLETLRNQADKVIADHRPKTRTENHRKASHTRWHNLSRRIMAGAQSRVINESVRESHRVAPLSPTLEVHLTAVHNQNTKLYAQSTMEAPLKLVSIRTALRSVDQPPDSDPIFEEEVSYDDLDRLRRKPGEVALVLASMEETLDETEAYELSNRTYVEVPSGQ